MMEMTFKLCVLGVLVILHETSQEDSKPKFRILAPQFICASDPSNKTAEENPGHTSIRFQTPISQNAFFNWNVRFKILLNSPTQRFTLMVWNVVRDLQKRLNAAAGDITKNNVVGINNSALLAGVEYQFFVWATSDSNPNTMSDMQQFALSYHQDESDPTLSVEDAADDSQISLVLVGSDATYAHIPYILEGQVTPCQPTNDYYLIWRVKSLESEEVLQMDYKLAKVLTIPAYTLVGGAFYEISCDIIKLSDNTFITRGFLTLFVKIRGLNLVLNVATLTIGVGSSINLTALATNLDNLPGQIDYEWSCNDSGESCDHFDSSTNKSLVLIEGFSKEGRYEIAVCARVGEEEATALAIVITVNAAPLIDVSSGVRNINEQDCVYINATVSRLLPGCTLTWDYVEDDHGKNGNMNFISEVPDSLSIISLEENFLSELADFNNIMEEKDFPLVVCPSSGRHTFRLEVQCVCTASFECVYENSTNIYADVEVKINKAPELTGILMKPALVYALQTSVSISTSAAEDDPSDYPLTYKFKYKVGDGEEVTVATYMELFVAQILFPQSGSEITPIIEVCDVWNACSSIAGTPFTVLEPEGNDFATEYLSLMYSQIKRGDSIEFYNTAKAVLCTFQVMKRDSSSILSALREYLSTGRNEQQNVTVNIDNFLENKTC